MSKYLGLLRIVFVGVAATVAFASFDGSLFSWHPLFMSLGFLIFMSEGILGALSFRALDNQARVAAIIGHALMQVRAMVLVLLGFAVIFQNKRVHNKHHFMSTHSKWGLAALILTLLSPALGVLSFKRLGLFQMLPDTLQPHVKLFHRRLGIVTWLVALVAIQLALPHKAVYIPVVTEVWQAAIMVGAFAVVLLYNKKGGTAGPLPEAQLKSGV